jgi:hypothetical protein
LSFVASFRGRFQAIAQGFLKIRIIASADCSLYARQMASRIGGYGLFEQIGCVSGLQNGLKAALGVPKLPSKQVGTAQAMSSLRK